LRKSFREGLQETTQAPNQLSSRPAVKRGSVTERSSGRLGHMLSRTSAIRRDIDGLRAVAVLLVIIHHVAPSILTGGFVGVDVFFVISGFLITRIIDDALQEDRFRYVEFLWRRCRRIVPTLVVVLLGTLLLGACILTGPELVSLARHLAAGSLSLSNVLLYSEVGYFDTSAATKPLLHLWSLGVEEQFYLLWPLLLAVLPRARRPQILVVGAIVLLSLMLSENLAYSNPAQSFYMLHSRAWELGAGGMLALASAITPPTWLRVMISRPSLRSAASIAGMILIVGAAFSIKSGSAWPGLNALVPVLGTVLLLAAGPGAWMNRTVLSIRPAQWIGQRSYALYLWHWPPIAFLHIIASEHAAPAETMQWITVALMIPVLVLAHATFLCVERPVRDLATRIEAHGHVSVRHLLPFGAALAVLAISANVVMRSHGFPARYGSAGTDAIAALQDASADSITSYSKSATRCQLQDKGAATWCWRIPGSGTGVAVFGDSHAEVIFAGLASSTARRPLFLAGRNGCAPILQLEVIPDRLAEICRRSAQLAHTAILSDTSIHTVLLVSRGPAYITGSGFGVDAQRAVVPVAIRRLTTDSSALPRAFELGLERSIKLFVSAGKRVVLIVGVPELGFMPEECLIGRPFGLREVRSPCAVSRTAVDQRNTGYRRLVATIAARNPALAVFDAQPLFCDGALCRATEGERLLYQDGNHLTIVGSRLVAQRLNELLAVQPRDSPLAVSR